MNAGLMLAHTSWVNAVARFEEAYNQLEAIEESIEDELEALVIDDDDMFHVKQLGRLWVIRQSLRFRVTRRAELAATSEMHYKVVMAQSMMSEL